MNYIKLLFLISLKTIEIAPVELFRRNLLSYFVQLFLFYNFFHRGKRIIPLHNEQHSWSVGFDGFNTSYSFDKDT
jgi:hypothetical protein